jgi:hypothetical protein
MMGREDGRLLRSVAMVAAGEGLDDLKIHHLLREAMKEAPGGAAEAAAYFKKLHVTWDADHRKDQSYPYLGLAADWGYDRFYQDWQEHMARYAARFLGRRWVD